jgi:hypothetical protein
MFSQTSKGCTGVKGVTGSEARETGRGGDYHNTGMYAYDASSIPFGVNEGLP